MINQKPHSASVALQRTGVLKRFFKLALAGSVVIAGVAFYFVLTEKSHALATLEASQRSLCVGKSQFVGSRVRELFSDFAILSDEVTDVVIKQGKPYKAVASAFTWVAKHKFQYARIRLLDTSNHEILAVDNLSGDARIVYGENVATTEYETYTTNTLKLSPGEVNVSGVWSKDNPAGNEFGQSAMFSLATPLVNNHGATGRLVVAIDYRIQKFIDDIGVEGSPQGAGFAVVYANGHSLRCSHSQERTAGKKPCPSHEMFSECYPHEWATISISDSGQLMSDNGLFTFITLGADESGISKLESLRRIVHSQDGDIDRSPFKWIVISRVDSATVSKTINQASFNIILYAIVFLLIHLLISLLLARAIECRRRFQQKLRDSEALYRCVIDTATDAMVVIDSKSQIQTVNETTTAMFGYSRDELIGASVTKLMPEQYAHRHDTYVENGNSGSSTGEIAKVRDLEARRKNGTTFIVEVTVSQFTVNGEQMYAGVMRDITERKQAEKEITALALFAKYNPSPLVRVDNAGNIIEGNPAAETVLGIGSPDSRALADVLPVFDRQTVESCIVNGSAINRYAEISGRSYALALQGITECGMAQLYAMDVTGQRQAEEDALTFGQIIDSSLNEIYVIDVETGKFVLVNKGARDNLGFSGDELLDLGPADIARGMGEDHVNDVQELLLRGERKNVEFRSKHTRKNGTSYPVEIHVQLSHFDSRPVFVAFAVDITDRIAAEERMARIEAEFKAEEERKRAVVDSIFTQVSRKTGRDFFHELTRLVASELEMDLAVVGEFVGENKDIVHSHSLFTMGKTYADYEYSITGTPCDEVKVDGFCSYAEGVQERFPDAPEAQRFNINGYIGALLPSSDGEALGLLAVTSSKPIVDLAFKESVVRIFAVRAASELERARAERKTELLSKAVAASSDVVMVTDMSGSIEYANPAFQKITGYSAAEVIGKNPRFLNSGKQNLEFYKDMWQSLLSENEWRGTIENRKKDGSHYIAEATISAIQNEEGDALKFICVQRDITERMESEQKLRQAQKMEAIGALAGGIAHDFNNMLMGISGFTQMVADELPADSPLTEDLQRALTASARAKDLVQQILTFSRQRETERKPVMIHLIVKEALKLLQATLPANIKIEQNVPVNCGLISGDPTQIHQIIMNLSTNAYHAIGEDDGTLSVSLKDETITDGKAAEALGVEPGEFLLLTVSDTGCGMDEQTQLRIFEPFFTTKAVGQGTGLGLATVFGIVKEYGGAITVESEVGAGSVFNVYFPRLHEDAKASDTPTIDDYRGTERALIVEDDEQTLQVIVKMLQKLGYRVVGERDPVAAIETLRANPDVFDVITTDKTMPKLSGMQLVRQAHQIRDDIPVLLLTGYAESITPEVATELGFSALLIKPVDSKTLGRAIQKAIKSAKNNVATLSSRNT